MWRLMRTAVCARTLSRSSEALTSSPISVRVARTSVGTSSLSGVVFGCGFDPVASMNRNSIAGDFRLATSASLGLCFDFAFAARAKANNAYIGQIPVTLVEVEAVADYEF